MPMSSSRFFVMFLSPLVDSILGSRWVLSDSFCILSLSVLPVVSGYQSPWKTSPGPLGKERRNRTSRRQNASDAKIHPGDEESHGGKEIGTLLDDSRVLGKRLRDSVAKCDDGDALYEHGDRCDDSVQVATDENGRCRTETHEDRVGELSKIDSDDLSVEMDTAVCSCNEDAGLNWQNIHDCDHHSTSREQENMCRKLEQDRTTVQSRGI
ncbi:hypothetical protein CAPTEDRAFT_215414 [Capitella teleta]|uniref:Uncharacterized protein n=1 Tax=Capitella teleta TaxID=283909 RepID=R7T8X1_CAPTE|nr:hypothetical protein CAPTEDRAFT_215414 [Capitella teleta]|eukprot:ELT90149.1 hypothetical protein CAPTEDRAFT_215414 [Capitella teleta]